MPIDRDEELANLISDFLQRDGFPPLERRQLKNIIICLNTARKEGRQEFRKKIIDQIFIFINDAMRSQE